jgi:hypothetical protein
MRFVFSSVREWRFYVLGAVLFAWLRSNALADAPAFPLKPSVDGRYLVDAADRPFFYHADTAWALPRNATLADANEYFERRAKEGFTAIHLHAVTKEVGPVKNVNGDEPFTPLEEILKPNEAWLDVNATYTYREVAPHVLAEWNRPYTSGKPKPIFLIESGYEQESNDQRPGTPHRVRRQAFGAILSGALMGHAYGHREVWRFSPKWREGVADVGAQQMRHVRDLFATRDWWKLRPDLEHELVTSRIDRVSPGDEGWASAARAADGSFAIVYLPAGRPVVVDLKRINGTVRATWFDPTNGSTQPAKGRQWREPSWAVFTPPEKNNDDDADFALVLEHDSTS